MADNRGANPAPSNGVDPNVAVPAHVRAAAAAAEAAHAAAYGTPAPPPVQPTQTGLINFAEPTYTPTQPMSRAEPWRAQPQQQPQPQLHMPNSPPEGQNPTQNNPDPRLADRANWGPEQWNHYAQSMEGRLRKSTELLSSMQEQVATLGDEVQRSQRVLQQPRQPDKPPAPLLTAQDEETFGRDMIDFARRAALDAVQPVVTDLRKQNQALQQRLQKTAASGIEGQLDASVPNWRDINYSSSFKAWLRLRDVYSRRVRQDLLNDAYAAGDAASVAAFFRGYLSENPTAQGELDNPLLSPVPAQPGQRMASVPLQTLTAPGHAQPPSGYQPYQDPAANMTITHAQIAQFYQNKRLMHQGKGPYAGREADCNNDEAFIFECQNAGRIR